MWPLSEARRYASRASRMSRKAMRSSASFSRLATSSASGMAALVSKPMMARVMTSSIRVKPRARMVSGRDGEPQGCCRAAADGGASATQHIHHCGDVCCGPRRQRLEAQHHQRAAALDRFFRTRNDIQLGVAALRVDFRSAGGSRNHITDRGADELQRGRVEAQLRAQACDALLAGELQSHLELITYLRLSGPV